MGLGFGLGLAITDSRLLARGAVGVEVAVVVGLFAMVWVAGDSVVGLVSELGFGFASPVINSRLLARGAVVGAVVGVEVVVVVVGLFAVVWVVGARREEAPGLDDQNRNENDDFRSAIDVVPI